MPGRYGQVSKMRMRILTEVIKNLFRKPVTIRFPGESKELSANYRGEHTFDLSKCRGCGLCAKVCPNKAIEIVTIKNGDKIIRYPKIDMGKCCFCGLCEDACPTGAIKLGRDMPRPVTDPSSLIKTPANIKNLESHEKGKRIRHKNGH
jgi:NADH-quinone oxidoreductase chain I